MPRIDDTIVYHMAAARYACVCLRDAKLMNAHLRAAAEAKLAFDQQELAPTSTPGVWRWVGPFASRLT